MKLSKKLVQKCLSVIDAGLSSGLGTPEPGKMCVEAAICYALNMPHGDDPGCVIPCLRAMKIKLNDLPWSTNAARAAGMRRLAIAQLGTRDNFDETEFAVRVALLHYAAPEFIQWANDWLSGKDRSKSAAESAESAAARSARSAESAAWSAARSAAARSAWSAARSAAYDMSLAAFAESVVQVLIAMKVPAVEYLDLAA